jgi:hypothetical protein
MDKCLLREGVRAGPLTLIEALTFVYSKRV